MIKDIISKLTRKKEVVEEESTEKNIATLISAVEAYEQSNTAIQNKRNKRECDYETYLENLRDATFYNIRERSLSGNVNYMVKVKRFTFEKYDKEIDEDFTFEMLYGVLIDKLIDAGYSVKIYTHVEDGVSDTIGVNIRWEKPKQLSSVNYEEPKPTNQTITRW